MTETGQSVPAVRFAGVSRDFGVVKAVDDVSFDIADGAFFAMLGPSGSGKTTCLRLVAGFDQPTAGQVFIHGDPMAGVPPYERDVHTVFQDYALFPHMSVVDNVAYGLIFRGVAKAERRKRAIEMLDMVKLAARADARPSQLSGGQRQRVALARALVDHPRVLLLDEPLGALDLKLREQMQTELKAIQRQVGITFVYVTHDQQEALTMSDRIAVFNEGRVEQIGTPTEIYERPASAFVAGFVGTSNILAGAAARTLCGSDEPVAIRPEKIDLMAPGAPEDGRLVAEGEVAEVDFLGALVRYTVAVGGGVELSVLEQNRQGDPAQAIARRGAKVRLGWRPEHARPLKGRA
jgi:putative spermidine/putrescine transport system ATP-binding protein